MSLLNGELPTASETRQLGWSAYGMDAYRKGNWKVLRLPVPYGSGDWQLYDLANDPGEIYDLSSKYPLRSQALADAWEIYAEANGIIQPNVATAYAKPVTDRKF
jgi:arylsulfatase A-like enzyme